MKLYLDDDTVDQRLVQQLERAGHVVWTPIRMGLSGVSDARHSATLADNYIRGALGMTLTQQQKVAVEQGQAVPVVIDGAQCVIVLEEVYERVKRLIDDESVAEEAYPAVLAAWDAVGSPQDAEDYRQ
jgi:hypothetical protein